MPLCHSQTTNILIIWHQKVAELGDVAMETMYVIVDTESVSSLQAVVCDGTNNSTEKFNGFIRKSLGRSLQ